MAPSAEAWEALSPAERAEVVAALPGEVTYDEIGLPEGDLHWRAKIGALTALRGYFARQKRRIYLASELPIYYPGEPRFAPDLVAVLDANQTLTMSRATSGWSAPRARGSTGCSRSMSAVIARRTRSATSLGTRGSGSPSTAAG
jgi:hypothetical protein